MLPKFTNKTEASPVQETLFWTPVVCDILYPMNKLLYSCLAVLLSTAAVSIKAQTNSWLVNSFETSADLAVISSNDTTVALSTNGVTLGQHSGRVTFNSSAWPNIYFKSGVAFTNLDWRSRGGLAVDVLNTNAVPIMVFIRVDDDFSADGSQHCQTASLNFPANASGTILMAFPQSAVTRHARRTAARRVKRLERLRVRRGAELVEHRGIPDFPLQPAEPNHTLPR